MNAHDPQRAIRMLRALQEPANEYRQVARARTLEAVLCAPPQAGLARCRDANTGVRFGRAACRRGRCATLGACSWSPTDTGTPYQIWAAWHP
jgi:hypothetical protein